MTSGVNGLVFREQLPGDRSASWRARDFLIDLGLPRGAFLERCMLLTSELVADAVEHAAHDELELCVRVAADRVRVEVSADGATDHGPSGAASGEAHDSLRLAIVEHLADAWGMDASGYPSMWFELLVPRGDPSAGVW